MADALRTGLGMRNGQPLSTEEVIAFLVQAEWDDRQQRRIDRYLRTARFRYQASIEEIRYDASRNLDRETILALASCRYIKQSEHIIIEGATGVGKSFLASAFGQQACLKGYKVLYFNTHKLFTRLKMSHADQSYHKEMARLEKHDMLILDDFGLHPFDAQTKLMLMEIMEDRNGKGSTLITSQFPVSEWHRIIGDATIADAILDRLVHRAHRIYLKGESLRKKKKGSVDGS